MQTCQKKNPNLGIEILRMILCFWILSFHSLENNKINYIQYYLFKSKYFHVPTFVLISFYFSGNIFFHKNISVIKKRLIRLLIPYIIWPLFVFIINNIFNNKTIPFRYLKLQILLGTQIMIPLWYLFSMIFLTIAFFILSRLLNKHFLFFIQLLSIIIYILQYSNYLSFLKAYKYNVSLPLLNTLYILPLSVLGFSFSSSKIVEFLKRHKKRSLLFSFLVIYLLFKYKIFIDLGTYNGIIHIFASSAFFFFFYIIPFENLSTLVQKIIKEITSYTNGIYCLQSRLIFYVKLHFTFHGTLMSTIIIYIFSYFISFIGIKLFGKTRLKYLFI